MYDPLRAKAKVAFFTAAAFITGLGVASALGWSDASLAFPALDDEPQVSAEAVKPALDLSDAFVKVADAVTPAVVRIEAVRPGQVADRQVPDIFQRFFGPDAPQGQREPQPQIGGGSGFLVSQDGYILTNDHVVSGTSQVQVYLLDGRNFPANVVGTDPFTDVAVIKIDVPGSLPHLSFGDSESVRVGEWVLAVGNPGFGGGSQLEYTVTAGIVSARGRGLRLLDRELLRDERTAELAGYAIEDFIQTDAVINPGNSGGPMVDLQGRVVGINSAIASATGFYQGYGFAIPVNLARRVMQDLIEYGHVKRPMLGVQIGAIGPEDAEEYGLPSVSGVLVHQVTEGGPAAQAGLQAGDVIVAVGGEPVAYTGQLQQRVAQFHPGDRVTVTVYRNKRPMEIDVRLTEAPLNEVARAPVTRERVAEERLGIQVETLTQERARQFGFRETGGVVITSVERASAAERRGLGPGLRIVSINGEEVDDPDDVRDALEDVGPGEIVTFRVDHPNVGPRIINVRMPR